MVASRPTRVSWSHPRRPLLLGLVVALICVQFFLREPGESLLWPALFDAGHAPLFGMVALALLLLLRRDDSQPARDPIRQYPVALALTALVGLLSELIQVPGPGDADPGDFGRDILGALAFLLVAMAFDPGLSGHRLRPPRRLAIPVAALLLVPAFLPVADTAIALMRRDAAFPRIAEFEDAWEERFVSATGALMERVSPPEGWQPAPSGRVARLEFQPGVYPGLGIMKLHSDWSGYNRLVFEIYSELPDPVELVFSIHDIGHEHDYMDRFNRVLSVNPGATHISIPLKDMQEAPRGRTMDLTRLCGLVLFADHPREAFTLHVDGFRLE